MKTAISVLSVIAFLAVVVSFHVVYISPLAGMEGVIDKGWSIFSLIASFIIYKTSKWVYLVSKKHINIIGEIPPLVSPFFMWFLWKIVFWAALNNFIDEFFGDPFKAYLSEYAIVSIMAIITFAEAVYYKRKAKKE